MEVREVSGETEGEYWGAGVNSGLTAKRVDSGRERMGGGGGWGEGGGRGRRGVMERRMRRG